MTAASKPGVFVFVPLLCFLCGCGTYVQQHIVDVTAQDPAGRLGPSPYLVSLSEYDMSGRSCQELKVGGMAENAPFRLTVMTTAGGWLWAPPPPAPQMHLYLALPGLTTNKFFHLQIKPAEGVATVTKAEYQAFDAVCPRTGAPAFPVRCTATKAAKGWHIRLHCEISADEPDLLSETVRSPAASGTAQRPSGQAPAMQP